MKVVMDDGEEIEYGPGDFAVMAPGHDAWTIGDEDCVIIDWQGFADYANAPPESDSSKQHSRGGKPGPAIASPLSRATATPDLAKMARRPV